MKQNISIILFLFFVIFLNAQSPLEKRIDFAVQQVQIKNALRQLSLKSEVNIAFSSNFFSQKKRVSLEVKNETIDHILFQILQNTNVEYKAVGQQIVITSIPPKEKKLFTISGYLEDIESGERLISATIYCPRLGEATTTNEYGFYSLTLPEGEVEVVFKYFGCDEVFEKINLNKDVERNLALKSSLALSEVVVLGNKKRSKTELLYDDNDESIEKLKAMPTLGRGGDLIKQLNFLTGVESGVEGLGGMFVRGGNIDQNLTMIDGVNIYNPSHLLGLFSVYNYNTIKSAKLYKGDFPARYGGRISSVLDVRTKDGNIRKYHGEIAPGLLSSRLTFEGPILKNKLAFFINSRFSHIVPLSDVLFVTLGGENDLKLKIRFYDINAKIHYSSTKRNKFFLSFYAGKDAFFGKQKEQGQNGGQIDSFPNFRFEFDQNLEIKWGNDVLSFRWNHLFNNQLFSNTTFTYSQFKFGFADLETSQYIFNDTITDYSITFLEYQNYITDLGLKIDFDFIPSTKHYIRFGLGVVGHQFGTGNTSKTTDIEMPPIPIVPPSLKEYKNQFEEDVFYSAIDLDGYVEDEIKVSKSLKANVGLRFSLFGGQDNRWYGSVQPRLKIKKTFSSFWSAGASVTRTTQNLHLLTSSGLGLPIDVWIPSAEEIRPQTAWQIATSLQYERPSFTFKVESFYKKMNRLIFLKESIFKYEELTISDSTFIKGAGQSYGLEFSLEKEFKKIY
ncbi:MAG TPA: hypothetical protein ENJ53_01570, partial [Phaeodactylibacter sp.]|nr:hypothetical protein [Phaeodactylibacter sp.]